MPDPLDDWGCAVQKLGQLFEFLEIEFGKFELLQLINTKDTYSTPVHIIQIMQTVASWVLNIRTHLALFDSFNYSRECCYFLHWLLPCNIFKQIYFWESWSTLKIHNKIQYWTFPHMHSSGLVFSEQLPPFPRNCPTFCFLLIFPREISWSLF